MGQQPCQSCQGSGEEEASHADEVHKIVELLYSKHGWVTDPEVEAALAATDLPSYRQILKRYRAAEPGWDQATYGAWIHDKRVRSLAAGGCVFSKLSLYTVLAQLLYPAISKVGPCPRVLDVGCGTGFLTAVLARLVAPRGGHVMAIDMFGRQVEHAQRTMSSCCPELRALTSFACANGLEYLDPSGLPFHAIAVSAQAQELPQILLRQLAPGGRMVIPLESIPPNGQPSDPSKGRVYRKYWLVERGLDGEIAFSGRAGPIDVNFVPFLPPQRHRPAAYHQSPPKASAPIAVPTQRAIHTWVPSPGSVASLALLAQHVPSNVSAPQLPTRWLCQQLPMHLQQPQLAY